MRDSGICGDADLGMNTENAVMCPRRSRILRNRMMPWYFCTIPLLIQRPKPVPLVDFVVKNGSNSCFASSGRIPEPVSEIKTRTPFSLPTLLNSLAHSNAEPATFRHSLDCIANKVEKYLL